MKIREKKFTRLTGRIFLIVVVAVLAIILLNTLIEPRPDLGTRSPEPSQADAKPGGKKTWRKVADLYGHASTKSDVFHLQGGKQRITYTINGEYSPTMYVYLMEAGKARDKDHSFPRFTASMPGDTMDYLMEGDYYLDVMVDGAEWSVKIEEEV